MRNILADGEGRAERRVLIFLPLLHPGRRERTLVSRYCQLTAYTAPEQQWVC